MHVILFIFISHFLWPNTEPVNRTIHLSIGSTQTIQLHPPLFVENGSIARIQEHQDRFLVTAKKLGTTFIRSKNKKIKILVLQKQDFIYWQHLQSAIKNKRALELNFNGKCSVIHGRLLLWKDYLDIANSMKEIKNASCKNTYLFQASVDKEMLQEKLSEVFQSQNLPLPQYHLNKTFTFFVSKKDLEIYQNNFANYGFQFLPNKQNFTVGENIETQIYVSEIRKSRAHQIGLDLPGSIHFQGKLLQLNETDLYASLHAMEQNGNAKILASPKITSSNGEKGEFWAGGEIPIRATGYQVSKVIWKAYGIRLNVEPKADQFGNIQLKIDVEVSMPDMANKVDGIPGFSANKMSSHFYIKDNEYLVLSGLIKEDLSSSTQGLPLLSRIPVLGLLFGSEAYRLAKTELVIIVKPKIKRPINVR